MSPYCTSLPSLPSGFTVSRWRMGLQLQVQPPGRDSWGSPEISYELPLVLSLVPVVMLAGSFSLVDIVNAQSRYPFILVQPVSFVIFFLSAGGRDQKDSLRPAGGGKRARGRYHTEYSGMRFGLYFPGGIHQPGGSGLNGGGLLLGKDGGAPSCPRWCGLSSKFCIIIFFMIWMRGTLPRFLRYDQLMHVYLEGPSYPLPC